MSSKVSDQPGADGKVSEPDPADEMEQFDDLERNFHKVVQELVTDRSLDKFRQEYEKLHQSLVVSHDHNAQLIDKCRTLNNDILANANKVSSVMQISQNDQRTIAGLHHEFDKAWKLVEVSQNREQKSKEVIEGLKQEVANLSRLVEQGGALAFTQESSLQEITDSISTLKKEVTVQAQQLEQMTESVATSKEEQMTMLGEIEALNKEFEDLSVDLDLERAKNTDVAADVDKNQHLISKVKAEYKEMQDKVGENEKTILEKKDIIDELHVSLREEQRTMKSGMEDKRINLQNVHTKQKVHEDKVKYNQKVQEEISNYDAKFQEKDERKVGYQAQISAYNVELEKSQIELDALKKRKDLIIDEKVATRQHLNACRDEVKNLAVECNIKDLSVAAARRKIERARAEHHLVLSQSGNEKMETKIIEGQSHILTNEMLAMKVIAHGQREKIDQINKEIEDYSVKSSGHRSNYIQIREEIRIREDGLDKNNVQLSKLVERIKHQESMLEVIQSERDLGCRQLEMANAENQQLTDENKALMMSIRALKEEIRERDRSCLEIHMKQKVITGELVEMAKRIRELEHMVKEADELSTEHRNKIQRAMHLMSQAELDIMKQKQVVTDLDFSQFGLNISVTKKISEVELLKEKAATIKGIIEMGAMAFKKQTDQLNDLVAELKLEVAKQKKLVNRGEHLRALQLEQIRIQKQLIMESGKCKALEEELERPMNIHRWRFLEGTNPELSQLLRMNMELRDRLMVKINVLTRLSDTCTKMREACSKKETHLNKSYTGDIQEEFDYLNELLKQKQKQLAQITQRVNGQTDTVSSQKEQIMTIRTMVREEKAGYFETKKKVDEIRVSTSKSNNRAVSTLAQARAESRFIGGGFAVSGLGRRESAAEPMPLSPTIRTVKSALASPHIVQPKSASVIAKRKPRGWNPSRGPLKTILPTVSGSP